MKLFQTLPLAPAALGLMAPLAASAADLNIAGIQNYASSTEAANGLDQVTSITQFSDVQPTDWAYQALSNLIERYGCVAGYPNGTFKGRQAMTRYEAAALLNACLDRITEVTDELKRLMKEFEKELAVLKGRVDGLEAKVGELEATQFSTTTRLSGQATFVVGASAFGGSARNEVNAARREVGATSFNYDLQLSFDTSFSGQDLLRTVLRAGNFGTTAFGGAGPTGGLSTLEIAFQEASGPDSVGIDKLFYQAPLGGGFTATLGGRVGQEDMLALWPSAYPADTVLNLLTLNGAPAAYNKNLGPGAGLWWQSNGWAISASYVAATGNLGNSGTGGIGNGNSQGTGTVQLGYGSERWAVAAIYSAIQRGVAVPGATPFTAAAFEGARRTDAFGLSGFWQPAAAGWIPSISAGWGLNGSRYTSRQGAGALATSQSWLVGLQWSDVLAKGNDLGLAIGQPVFATALSGGQTPRDGGIALEAWYQWQLSDQITITPAVFYLSRPLGQDTPAGESLHQLGGLVKTTFRF